MAGTQRFFQTSEYPAEAGRVQLTLRIDVFSDRKGRVCHWLLCPGGVGTRREVWRQGKGARGVPRRHRRGSRLFD